MVVMRFGEIEADKYADPTFSIILLRSGKDPKMSYAAQWSVPL